jgi:hypothetical protein
MGMPPKACFELVGAVEPGTVSVVFVAPLGHFCEGCLIEVEELKGTLERVPSGRLRVVVIFTPLGEEKEGTLQRRLELLPGHVRGAVDRDRTCLDAESALARSRLGPWKFVVSDQLEVVAMDFCGETAPERAAFRTLVAKALRKLAPKRASP